MCTLKIRIPLFAATLLALAAAPGCNPSEGGGATFSIVFPKPNYIGFQAALTKHYGLGLSGSFGLPNNVGTIVLIPETPQKGFGLELDLNTHAFLKDTWADFREVSALPTGASFPGWMTGPVIDVTSPELNRGGVDYHFYFGIRTQYYVGVAGVIHALDGSMPSVNIGYTFYDDKGRVVVGFQFFGPEGGSPGGIFIGTNLSPFIPADAPAPKPTLAMASQMLSMVEAANHGQPVVVNGQSLVSDIVTSGPDAYRYRSKKSIRRLIDRFTEASRRTY